MSVNKGDTVKVDYVGKLEDGTVFDTSENHEEPLKFTVGTGQLIKGFDEGVIGMEVGDEKTLTLPPEEAYGEYNGELVQNVPRSSFPEGTEIHNGMMFLCGTEDGKQMPVRVTGLTDDEVTVDFNPPLAGKTLIFEVKLVEILENVE